VLAPPAPSLTPLSLGGRRVGSLRAAARSLDAEVGDWVLVRRVRTSAVDFILVRAADLGDDPERRLRGLIGAPESTGDLAEERSALLARREQDLVVLLDALAVGESAGAAPSASRVVR
jgi:hypothetical protein